MPFRYFSSLRVTLASVVLFALAQQSIAQLVPIPAFGVNLARGFRISLYAGPELANDIYAMTLDPYGNVLVTSQGYIKRLQDTDGDGRADSATLYATTDKGGMGLCADGTDLYFVGDGGVFRFQDANFDGVADGPPDRLFGVGAGEHGGHAIRKGPDGWFYFIGGNDSGFGPQHISSPTAVIRGVEAGALVRFSTLQGQIHPVAHGFRNPYDFDFNGFGELFTYDSDVESDYFLPWYTPTRLYHIGVWGHHGWRLNGYRRSWNRPPYYVDTIDTLAEIGRGSPTGVACYRHYQFPERYRNGLFALDWTFGRIYFAPLAPNGASYQTAPELFLEPIGSQGLAPTDVVVTPDGALLVSIGGRKTRGAIYRIDFPAAGAPMLSASNWLWSAASEAEAVINAPQPLDAWSRAFWVPVAARLGAAPFIGAAMNSRLSPLQRIRAIEVLTELHGGLSADAAALAAQANSPLVRGRVAWSLGRARKPNSVALLLALARDPDPLPRRCALEALLELSNELTPQNIQQALAANLAHPDERIRQDAARLATYLPEPAWKALWSQLSQGALQARLTASMALLWRTPPNSLNVSAIDAALSILGATHYPELRLQAVRLLILALGDYRLNDPGMEVFTGYEPALGPIPADLAERIRAKVETIFPSGNSTLDMESARLLAMVEDATPAMSTKTLSLINDRTAPSSDFHYLAALARSRAPLPTNAAARVAHAVLALDRKLDGLEKRPKQNWTARLAEVVQMLVAREPRVANSMISDPQFARPAHVALAGCMGSSYYTACAQKFLDALEKSPTFTWSGQLVDLLSALPNERIHPLLRKQWSNLGLRDEILIQLAHRPILEDRDKFIVGLGSAQTEVVRASMGALLKLPRDESGKGLVSTLRFLRRMLNQPDQQAARAQVLDLLKLQTGHAFKVDEPSTAAPDLRRAYEPVFAWFATHEAGVLRQMDADDAEDPARWAQILRNVKWESGDSARGEELFRQRGCETCHASATPIGPDLGGITDRLSASDLFNAILFPSRDVAPPYRTTHFRTRDGQSYTGIVVFESADGVIVQTGADMTVRLAEQNILSRQISNLSLMPSGLLSGLRQQSFADLYKYLATLRPAGQ
jgi:putative membrane-bound dehydrogenase-like protein